MTTKEKEVLQGAPSAQAAGPFQNTDREIWRERPGDYYADSIHVTDSGSIGINVGGHVVVMPAREWHALAQKKLPLDPNGKPWIGYCDLCNGQHCLQVLDADAQIERSPHRSPADQEAVPGASRPLKHFLILNIFPQLAPGGRGRRR